MLNLCVEGHTKREIRRLDIYNTRLAILQALVRDTVLNHTHQYMHVPILGVVQGFQYHTLSAYDTGESRRFGTTS